VPQALSPAHEFVVELEEEEARPERKQAVSRAVKRFVHVQKTNLLSRGMK
jgi:hypothetical protein